MRIKGTEIRQQYVYFGRTLHERYVGSAEGELHWVETEGLLQLSMSTINRCMLDHYFQHSGASEDVLVGTMTTDDCGHPVVEWAKLKEPTIF